MTIFAWKRRPAGLFLLLLFSIVSQGGAQAQEAPATVESTLDNLRGYLMTQRKDASYWSGAFTADASSDALTLALGKKIGKLTPELSDSYMQSIQQRMTDSQEGWPAYYSGPADFNVTSITLLCLRYVGVGEDDPRFQTAWAWFQNHGGEKKLQMYAKLMLAPLDLVAPDKVPSMSPRTFGMPTWFPMHLNKDGFLRGLVVPSIGIRYLEGLDDNALRADQHTVDAWKQINPEIMDFKFKHKSKIGSKKCEIPEEDVDAFFAKVDANPEQYKDCVFYHQGSGKNLKAKLIDFFFHTPLTEKLVALNNLIIDATVSGPKAFWAEQALIVELQLLNPGGAWYTMGFNLMGIRMLQEAQRVGLGDFQSQIDSAWLAVQSMRTTNQDHQLVQQWVMTGTWDTASVLNAFEPLRGTRWALADADVTASVDWLLGRSVEQDKMRGWSFDQNDRTLPDVDDTAIVLAALGIYQSPTDPAKQQMIDQAVEWLRSRQNKDGGYPAWATSMSHFLVKLMGQKKMMTTLADFSQPDVTGRVMYAFDQASRALAPGADPATADSLAQSQSETCSFLADKMPEMKQPKLKLAAGNWMVNYVYSAASVLTGLTTAGCGTAKQAELAEFIISAQQASGGWGEAPTGYASQSYVEGKPTTMQSAVAIAGLISYYEALTQSGSPMPATLVPAIEHGVEFLIGNTDGGTNPIDAEYTGVLIRGMTFARYELAPAYLALYALGRWEKLKPAISSLN